MEKQLMKGTVLLAALGVFLSPVYTLLILVVVLCLADVITAIMRDFKKSDIKGFWKKLVIIKSRKLRRHTTKTILYILLIVLLFATTSVCLDADAVALWVARGATLMISINELYSIAENMGVITGKNIFVKIVKNSVMKLNEKINLKIEDKIDD